MHLTTKQLELLRVIAAANSDGSACDLDEIIERINYETTKASIQFSIRALIKHGLIEKVGKEKRRDRQRVLIGITSEGKGYVSIPRSSPGPAFVVSEEEALLEEIFEGS
ncbi:winged helix DNA-binding protein [Paraburkholderia sp.]|uniref:winged helix DNA-binding protein n=1 Tax=Paraburkholderia sp. TaxID=1926495 RepID=UPI0039E252B5